MRIKKFIFPLILLVIFIGVIALGMALGYWQTKGGRGRGPQSEILAPTTVSMEIQTISDFDFDREQSVWLL